MGDDGQAVSTITVKGFSLNPTILQYSLSKFFNLN